MRTAQTVFNKVVAHLRKQGKKSKNDTQCVYRNEDGLKCAVGCLIPKKLYLPEYEHKSIGVLLLHLREKFSKTTPSLKLRDMWDELNHHEALLSKLQQVHDNTDISVWEKNFERVARESFLKLKPKKK